MNRLLLVLLATFTLAGANLAFALSVRLADGTAVRIAPPHRSTFNKVTNDKAFAKTCECSPPDKDGVVSCCICLYK